MGTNLATKDDTKMQVGKVVEGMKEQLKDQVKEAVMAAIPEHLWDEMVDQAVAEHAKPEIERIVREEAVKQIKERVSEFVQLDKERIFKACGIVAKELGGHIAASFMEDMEMRIMGQAMAALASMKSDLQNNARLKKCNTCNRLFPPDFYQGVCPHCNGSINDLYL